MAANRQPRPTAPSGSAGVPPALGRRKPRSRRPAADQNSAPSFPRRRESGLHQPRPPPEIKHKYQPTDPFPLYGGRLGWGSAARKRGSAGGTPALPAADKNYAPSFPRKRESGGHQPRPPPEIKYKSRATNPFPLHGGRLGWGSRRRDARAPSRRPKFRPVIPAKAGIQTIEAKTAARNQVQTASDKSLPPSWGKARMGEPRAYSPRPRRQQKP